MTLYEQSRSRSDCTKLKSYLECTLSDEMLISKTNKFRVDYRHEVSFNLFGRLRVSYNKRPNNSVKTDRPTNNLPWMTDRPTNNLPWMFCD